MDLNALLARAVELGASDIHLKLGRPPIIRRDGALGELRVARPARRADLRGALERVCAGVAREAQQFHESGDLDSRTPPTSCRASASTPSASAARSRSPSASSRARCRPSTSSSLPPGVPRARRGAPRPRPRHGRDRLGQDDDARRDDRPHQPVAAAAHRHDRGPDRDPPSRPRLHRQPARGRARHRVVRAGAPPRAAPGPGRDPDRRAPRRGDGADRAPGGRVRPPRALDDAHDRRRRDASAG